MGNLTTVSVDTSVGGTTAYATYSQDIHLWQRTQRIIEDRIDNTAKVWGGFLVNLSIVESTGLRYSRTMEYSFDSAQAATQFAGSIKAGFLANAPAIPEAACALTVNCMTCIDGYCHVFDSGANGNCAFLRLANAADLSDAHLSAPVLTYLRDIGIYPTSIDPRVNGATGSWSSSTLVDTTGVFAYFELWRRIVHADWAPLSGMSESDYMTHFRAVLPDVFEYYVRGRPKTKNQLANFNVSSYSLLWDSTSNTIPFVDTTGTPLPITAPMALEALGYLQNPVTLGVDVTMDLKLNTPFSVLQAIFQQITNAYSMYSSTMIIVLDEDDPPTRRRLGVTRGDVLVWDAVMPVILTSRVSVFAHADYLDAQALDEIVHIHPSARAPVPPWASFHIPIRADISRLDVIYLTRAIDAALTLQTTGYAVELHEPYTSPTSAYAMLNLESHNITSVPSPVVTAYEDDPGVPRPLCSCGFGTIPPFFNRRMQHASCRHMQTFVKDGLFFGTVPMVFPCTPVTCP